MNSENLIKAMAQKNGLQVVKAKLVEECAELIRALARGGDRNIIEELVDVQIMLEQMLELLPESKAELLEEVAKEKYQHLEFLLDLPKEKQNYTPHNYKNLVCKGSFMFGTACGTCERCEEQLAARLIDEVSG